MVSHEEQKIELPGGTFFGNCFNCQYADWNRCDENGRVLCTVKQGEYVNAKEKNGCFYFEEIHVVEENVVENSEGDSENSGKIIGSIAGLLATWLIILFYQTANKACESNMDAFDWLNKEAESLGHTLHWGIPLYVLITCAVGIGIFFLSGYKSKNILLLGSDLLISGALLWSGRSIYSDYSSNDDNSYVFWRIFRTYYERVEVLLLIAGVLLILGFYLKYKEAGK